MTYYLKKIGFKLSFIALALSLAACTATHTALSKRNLNVETKMSDSIFLEPSPNAKRTVYVQVRNTTGNQRIYLQNELNQQLSAKGYNVVNDPDQAQYMVQANILQVSKMNLTERNRMLEDGFGGGLLAATTAAVLGANSRTTLAAGLGGAVIGAVTNAVVKDNYYTLITDVRISERTKHLMTESLDSNLPQGVDGNTKVKGNKKTHWKRYQTRIVSTANQVNLNLDDALPEIEYGAAAAIAGVF